MLRYVENLLLHLVRGEGGGREGVEIDFGLICHSQAHTLPQVHLWARSLWLWGEGFVVSNIGGLGE